MSVKTKAKPRAEAALGGATSAGEGGSESGFLGPLRSAGQPDPRGDHPPPRGVPREIAPPPALLLPGQHPKVVHTASGLGTSSGPPNAPRGATGKLGGPFGGGGDSEPEPTGQNQGASGASGPTAGKRKSVSGTNRGVCSFCKRDTGRCTWEGRVGLGLGRVALSRRGGAPPDASPRMSLPSIPRHPLGPHRCMPAPTSTKRAPSQLQDVGEH